MVSAWNEQSELTDRPLTYDQHSSSIVFMTAIRSIISPDDASNYKINTVPDINGTQRSNDIISNEIIQIMFCIWYATVFVLGVLGNVLVCYVVLRNRAMQTVTNIFITNLALSDILLCILAVPFTPLYTFMGRWVFGQTLCHLVSFAQGCSIYTSSLTLTSIAVDRYIVIIHPFHPRMKIITCLAIIVSIWTIALIATLPYGMYMKVVLIASPFNHNTNNNDDLLTSISKRSTKEIEATTSSSILEFENLLYNTPYGFDAVSTPMENSSFPHDTFISYCEENWPSEHYRKIFGSVTTILQFVLPFIIISICYTWISCKLNARAKRKPGTKTSRKEEEDRDRKRRTNRMLIAMVTVFGVSWLPLNLVNIFDDFYAKSNEWRFYTFFFFVAHSIAMSSTCYNPFLYAWLNENFRKEFKHALPCFQNANNNFMCISHAYAGSMRCKRHLFGQTNRPTAGGGTHGSSLENNDDHENGITQDTCTHKEKLGPPTNEVPSTQPLAVPSIHFHTNVKHESVARKPCVEIPLNDRQFIDKSDNTSTIPHYDETQFITCHDTNTIDFAIITTGKTSTNTDCFAGNSSLQFTGN